MSKIILTETILVNDKYFLRHERYDYTTTVYNAIDCNDCGNKYKYKQQLCFRVVLSGINYDIPETACVPFEGEFDESRINMVNHIYEKYSDNITNYKKAVKEYLGIDTTYKADISIDYLRYVEKEKNFFRRTDARIQKPKNTSI